jgi:hypothetical protein
MAQPWEGEGVRPCQLKLEYMRIMSALACVSQLVTEGDDRLAA